MGGNDPLKRGLTHALAFWAVVGPLWVLSLAAVHGQFALDFRHAFLPAAHAVVRGSSPYSAVGSPLVSQGIAFLYPPVGAFMLAPFTLLPPLAAEIVAVVLAAACVPATLLTLGVRDWRCHAIAFLWWPTIVAICTANLTLPMVLGLALVWRYRDQRLISALLAGLVVALKLFFWPVLLWFVATRRYRTAALAALAAAVFVVVPWAGIGFAGLRGYPHLLASVSRHEGAASYSLAALLHAVVLSWTASTALETLAGGVLLVLVFAAGRRGRERDAFAVSVVAVLVFTPLLEMHYLAVLLVVVALYRRQFGLAWVAPLLLVGAPGSNPGSGVQAAYALALVAVTVALAVSESRSRLPAPTPRPHPV
jgi:hypothetical protein